MNSKNFITVVLLFFSSLYSLNSYSATCEVKDKKTVIYYANGINNTAAQALSSVNAINSRFSSQLKTSYPSEEFEFKPSFNQSIRFDKDIIETINQKATETGGLTAFELLQLAKLTKDAAVIYMEYINSAAKRATLIDPTSRPRTIAIDVAIKAFDKASDAIAEYYQNFAENEALAIEARTQDDHIERYRKNIQSGNRTIVVAHSQGNLFTNNAISIVRSEYPEDERSLVSLGVGTPASTLLPFSDYITNANDFIINLLRPLYDVLPATNFPTIDEIALIPSFSDFISHNFQASYFDENKATGRAFNIKLLGLIRTSTFPCEELVIPPPTNLSAVADDTSIELSWDNLPPSANVAFSTYTVYASKNRLFTTESAGVEKFSNILGDTFEYPNPIFGTNYFFAVTRTVNGVESQLSEIAFATLTEPVQPDPPNAPTNVNVEGGESTIAVSWDRVSGARGYNVYVSTSPDIIIGGAGVGNFPAGSSPFVYRNADIGETYYFAVTSVVGEGEDALESELSSIVSGSLDDPEPETPNPPASITAAGDEDSITVNWSTVTGATGYNLYVSGSPGITIGARGVSKEARGSSTSFSFPTEVTTPFYFAVTSVVGGVESGLSREVSASIEKPVTELLPPTNVSASGKANIIIVNWEGTGNDETYIVFISEDPDFEKSDTGVTNYMNSVSPLTISNDLVVGTEYFIAVSALKDGEESDLSAKVSASLLEPPVIATGVTTRTVPTVGKYVEFDVEGENLQRVFAASLEGTSNCRITSRTTNELIVGCTPEESGTKNLFLALEAGGDPIEGSPFSIEIAPADVVDPVVTSITPTQAIVGEEVSFTLIGTDLPSTIAVSLEGTDNCEVGSQSETQVIVTCTPQTAGSQRLFVADEPGGDAIEGTPEIIEVVEEASLNGVVTSLSPLEVVVGEDTLFTIVGTNLPLNMVVQLTENDNCMLQGEPNSTQQQFLCANITSTTDTLTMSIGEFGGEELEGSPIVITAMQPPISDVIVSYDFNGNLDDSSDNALNGVSTQPLEFNVVGERQVLVLDGISDYFEIPDEGKIDFSGIQPFTISVWIQVKDDARLFDSSSAPALNIISNYNGNFSGEFYLNIRNNGNVGLLREISPFITETDAEIPLNEFVLITATYNGDTTRIYINDQLEASRAMGASRVDNANVLVGAIKTNGQVSEYFDGNIDSLVLYNRALSNTEISELYALGKTDPPINELTPRITGISPEIIPAQVQSTVIVTGENLPDDIFVNSLNSYTECEITEIVSEQITMSCYSEGRPNRTTTNTPAFFWRKTDGNVLIPGSEQFSFDVSSSPFGVNLESEVIYLDNGLPRINFRGDIENNDSQRTDMFAGYTTSFDENATYGCTLTTMQPDYFEGFCIMFSTRPLDFVDIFVLFGENSGGIFAEFFIENL